MRAVLLAALLGLAVAAPAAAARPELGARVSAQHLPIVWEMDPPTFAVLNQSSIAVRVRLELADGWGVDADSFTLAVGATRTVRITAAGEAPATIAVILTGIGIVATDATALRFEVGVRHASWIEQHAFLAPWAVLVALVALLAALRLSRTRRREARHP